MCLATIDVEGDRHFGDLCADQARLDDHLGGELHSGAALTEALVVGAREAPQAAVDVLDWRVKPAAGEPREHRVPPPAVEKGHGARHDLPAAGREPAALHQVVALAELGEEGRNLAE